MRKTKNDKENIEKNSIENKKSLLARIIIESEPVSPVNMYKARAVKRGKSWTAMMYMDARFNNYKKLIIKCAKEQVDIDKPYDGPVAIKAKFFFGSKRKKDLSNAGKLEYDALNGIVYEDDSQVFAIESEKIYDKENPRAEIEVYTYPEAQWD